MKYLVFIHHFLFYLSIAKFIFSLIRTLHLGRALGYGMGDLLFYLIWLVTLLITTGLYVYDWNHPHWLLKTLVVILSVGVIIHILLITYVYYGAEARRSWESGKWKW